MTVPSTHPVASCSIYCHKDILQKSTLTVFKTAKQDYTKFGYDIPVIRADTKAAADKINQKRGEVNNLNGKKSKDIKSKTSD